MKSNNIGKYERSKNVEKKCKHHQVKAFLICLAALLTVACTNLLTPPRTSQLCMPTVPQLEWIETGSGKIVFDNVEFPSEEGGLYMPPQAVAALTNYILDLENCLVGAK